MKRILLIVFLITTVAAVVMLAWLRLELYRPYRAYSGNIILVVDPGTSAPSLAQTLVQRGVLESRLPFLLRYTLGRLHSRIKAGEYLFDRPLRPIDVYQKFVRGEVYLHPVLIPEGSDRFDIAGILNRDLKIDEQEFLRITGQAAFIQDLDPKATTLEGYLFPDTYRFPRGVSPSTVVEAMLTRFRHVYDAKVNKNLESSGKSPHDVITLASLVEKETPNPVERPIVAGVFARRLERGMVLACDPTVVYAARLNHRMLERPLPAITRSDLEFDSPYNTYRHAGLPPGPIANPGQASILASLSPAPGAALYFVSNNHGGHVFANTLAEHERNVARYRREVAELRSQVHNEASAPAHPSSENQHAGSQATSGSTKRGTSEKQKTAHPRAQTSPGSGTGRSR
ncbi:MAG TPA: endolytic transglycosylase MltG [Terriglobia bacterium]|nr:endolytic transglycosylase MltG [Terriglobia bacterium]